MLPRIDTRGPAADHLLEPDIPRREQTIPLSSSRGRPEVGALRNLGAKPVPRPVATASTEKSAAPSHARSAWKDLPAEITRVIADKADKSSRIGLFFAGQPARDSTLPDAAAERAAFLLDMAQEATCASAMRVVVDQLETLPPTQRAQALEEITGNLSLIQESVGLSSYEDIAAASQEAAELYGRLRTALDSLPASATSAAVVNLAAHCELLPNDERFPEMKRLLTQDGGSGGQPVHEALLRDFSQSLYQLPADHVVPAAALLMEQGMKGPRELREAVKANLSFGLDGLLLPLEVIGEVKATIRAAESSRPAPAQSATQPRR